VASKDILQCSCPSSHYSESELAIVEAIGIKIDTKDLKQLIQFEADELDVSAGQGLLKSRQNNRDILFNLVHHPVREPGAVFLNLKWALELYASFSELTMDVGEQRIVTNTTRSQFFVFAKLVSVEVVGYPLDFRLQ